MNDTKIEWTDFSWNPVSGCKHGCVYCYARDIYKRYGWSFEPQIHQGRMNEPFREKKPSKIFVCSVADLFGEWVPTSWIDQVLDIAIQCPQHTFQFLTKNPERLLKFAWPKNCWIGATATSKLQWDRAETVLQQANATVRFISAEPLLAEIVPNCWFPDWLIIGACTGRLAKQPNREWVLSLIARADTSNIPVFLKPNLTIIPPNRKEFPLVTGQALLFSTT